MHLWDQKDILQIQNLNTHALVPRSISSVLPSAILFLLNNCAIVVDNIMSARIRDIEGLIAGVLQEVPLSLRRFCIVVTDGKMPPSRYKAALSRWTLRAEARPVHYSRLIQVNSHNAAASSGCSLMTPMPYRACMALSCNSGPAAIGSSWSTCMPPVSLLPC
jgi:hypothetical protein